jgi:hypothetical protein
MPNIPCVRSMDLLWDASSRDYARQRAHPYKAPTWSWASTIGPPNSLYYFAMTSPGGSHYISKIRARVVSVEWEGSSQELLCTEARGALTLAAPLTEVQICPCESALALRTYDFEIRHTSGLRTAYIPDVRDHQPRGSVFCLLIAEAMVNFQTVVQASILEKTESGSNKYARIGSMINALFLERGFDSEMSHPDIFFGDIEDSIITIV